jgi:hypothetical protein
LKKNNYPEIGEHVLSLHILSPQTNLPEGLIFIILKISQTDLKHSVFQSLRGNLWDSSGQRISSQTAKQPHNIVIKDKCSVG